MGKSEFVNSLRENIGLYPELKKFIKKIYYTVRGIGQRKKFKKFKSEIQGKRVIVFPPVIDWNIPLYQRPQQLAAAYAKKENTVVAYMTKNTSCDKIFSAERINESLWGINAKYEKELIDALNTANEVIISVSRTDGKKYFERINPQKLIYEYIDELELFDSYGPQMVADHVELMKKADVTVCTATQLYNKAVKFARNPILSPNAGDYDFFAKTEQYPISPMIEDRLKGYDCVIGYYGSVAAWFDYGIIKEAAKKRPGWAFVLLGYDYDKTIWTSGIAEYENIIYIPAQPYEQLPSFLKAFDVATIPFVINEITLSTSPVKLFEYMAAGKPILTSAMPECMKYKSVKIYNDADEFCDIVENFINMDFNNIYWKQLKQDALNNTWDARTDEILDSLK